MTNLFEVTYEQDWTPQEALAEVKRRIRRWLRTTEEGQEAEEASCYDFNWGDVTLLCPIRYLDWMSIRVVDARDVLIVDHDERF